MKSRAQLSFNLPEGERRRDAGISLTTGNNIEWMARALAIVRVYAPRSRDFMAEEFRLYPGIGTPASPNAWGALTRTLVRQGVIEHTGRYSKASSTRNHAHAYPVYRRPSGGSAM